MERNENWLALSDEENIVSTGWSVTPNEDACIMHCVTKTAADLRLRYTLNSKNIDTVVASGGCVTRDEVNHLISLKGTLFALILRRPFNKKLKQLLLLLFFSFGRGGEEEGG